MFRKGKASSSTRALHGTIAKLMKTFNEKNTLLLEDLPPLDKQVTFAHLVKTCKSIQKYQGIGTSESVKISSHEEAKFALAGTNNETVLLC